MRLVFVARSNPLARTLIRNSPLGQFEVFSSVNAAADALRKTRVVAS
jgi:hypothetical protein